MRYWLIKSEPDTYSIDDLKREKVAHWDGVRNYQARNFMRDQMKQGDQVLFYHSNAKPSGIVGVAQLVREGYPDYTAMDQNSPYFDSKSTPSKPTWIMVDVGFIRKFKRCISLAELKNQKSLNGLMVVRKGMRLSIQPVEKAHFEYICRMAE